MSYLIISITKSKVCLTIVSCIMFLISFNNCSAQLTMCAKGGLSISEFLKSKHSNNQSINSYSSNPFVSFNTELSIKYNINSYLQVQSGVSLISKGSGVSISHGSSGVFGFDYEHIQVLYIQIPANLIYTFYNKNKATIFVGAGLYAARAIWGAETGKGYSYGLVSSYTISDRAVITTSHDNHLLPVHIYNYDAGYNIVTGITLQHLEVAFNLSKGLVNVYTNTYLYDGKYRNATLNIILGYCISLK